jgi:DNA repair ATPase RecN
MHSYLHLTAHAAHALGGVHEGMAQVYPGAEPLVPVLVSLIGRAPLIAAHDGLSAAQTELEASLTQVDEKLKVLAAMVQERAHFREEVQHYKDKLAKLENKPDAGPKIEENKAKLADMENKFHTNNGELVPMMEALDADLARLTTDSFQKVRGRERREGEEHF